MNFWSKSAKMLEQTILMIQTHLLSVQLQWMTFMRILMIQPKQKKKNFNCVWWYDCRDIMTNKKFQARIKELFIRCRKLNISLVFIMQSYFSAPKDVRLISTHYLIMKINNRKEFKILQLIIPQTLITKIFWRLTENAQENCFHFWQMILCYQQVIL